MDVGIDVNFTSCHYRFKWMSGMRWNFQFVSLVKRLLQLIKIIQYAYSRYEIKKKFSAFIMNGIIFNVSTILQNTRKFISNKSRNFLVNLFLVGSLTKHRWSIIAMIIFSIISLLKIYTISYFTFYSIFKEMKVTQCVSFVRNQHTIDIF